LNVVQNIGSSVSTPTTSNSFDFVPPKSTNVSTTTSTSPPNKKSKITKTATGISLFILLFSFGLFLNFNSISPMQQQQQQQMNPNWRVGRVILSHEKWYHQYIPVYFHSFVDFTVDLFMNPMQLPQNIEQTTTIEKNNFPNNNGDVNSRSDL